jgi:hypothetical protein
MDKIEKRQSAMRYVINWRRGQGGDPQEPGERQHWMIVNTVGTASNRDGIGARLHLVSESGLDQYATVSTAGSYQSSSDKRVHFWAGLGQKCEIARNTMAQRNRAEARRDRGRTGTDGKGAAE